MNHFLPNNMNHLVVFHDIERGDAMNTVHPSH
jgi:hypothetical protein